MTLVRWNPAALSSGRDLANLHDEFNQMFDSFLTRGVFRGDVAPVFVPAIDIEETGEAFILRCDLPGVSQKDVKVSLMGDQLTIRGERRHEASTADGNYRRVERIQGAFERSFTLGTPVHADRVKATYKDGVLEITVPKAEEARMREIEVKVASS